VLQLAWFPNGEHLVTASADKSVRCWDADTGTQVKRLSEHTGVVNSCCPMHRGPELFVSGSDDGTVKVRWRCRVLALTRVGVLASVHACGQQQGVYFFMGGGWSDSGFRFCST